MRRCLYREKNYRQSNRNYRFTPNKINNSQDIDETSSEERHSRIAMESALEKEYPRIDTENL